MANQFTMAKVCSILTLHQRGWSGRRIARELGIHCKTVGRYVRLAEAEEAEAASLPRGAEIPDGLAAIPFGAAERLRAVSWDDPSEAGACPPRSPDLAGSGRQTRHASRRQTAWDARTLREGQSRTMRASHSASRRA